MNVSFWRLGVATLSICVAIAAFAVYFVKSNVQIGQRSLPSSYGLCSRDGPLLFTVDVEEPTVQCLLVHFGRFVARGSLASLKKSWVQIRDDSQPISLPLRFIERGAIVVPGLIDAHGHIFEYGVNRQLDLESATSKEDVVRLVKDYVKSFPEQPMNPTTWIEGRGFDHTKWPEQAWPSSEDLDVDPLLRDRYIVIHSKDGHALWISRKIRDSIVTWPKEVTGGVILLRDGKPTGILIDDARSLVEIPMATDAQLRHQFTLTVQDALAHGLTMITDAAFQPFSFEALKRFWQEGKLPIRIYAMHHFDPERESQILEESLQVDWEKRLVMRSVKLFADGALRSSGAALHEPYNDDRSFSGFMRISPKNLTRIVSLFTSRGWQVNVHAIGDRANSAVLDAFANAIARVNVNDSRPRLEHAQMLSSLDIERVGRLGVIASVQPSHAISDMWYAEERVGYERAKRLYPFQSLLEAGVRLAFGSDFPVESQDPMVGFYSSLTRRSVAGTSPHGPAGWFPHERISRTDALRAMTLDAAYASFADHELGSLSVGKRADFTVLSRNIMTIDENELLGTRVLATVIDGAVAYGAI